jgi:WD40 repeat protein
VAISKEGALVAALCETRDVLVFDVAKETEIAHTQVIDGAGGTTFLEFTAQGDLLVLWSNGVSQLNLKTGQWREPSLSPHPFPAFCNHYEVSPDGESVAICFGGPSSGVQVWDLTSGRAVSEVLLHPALVPDTCFSGDGRLLFTGCRDGQARLWDVHSGKLAGPPCLIDDEVGSVFLSPDARWGITGNRRVASGDGAVRVWDVRAGKPIAPPFVISRASAEDVKASPNGRHIFAATEHSTIRLLDLAQVTSDDGEPLDNLQRMAELAGGQRVVAGELAGLSAEDWIRLWTERPQRSLPGN